MNSKKRSIKETCHSALVPGSAADFKYLNPQTRFLRQCAVLREFDKGLNLDFTQNYG